MEDDGGRRRVGREMALGGLLTADQVADAIVWAISQPSGVDVNTVIVRPTGQLDDHDLWLSFEAGATDHKLPAPAATARSRH